MSQGNKLKFQRGAATKAEGEDRNNGGRLCSSNPAPRMSLEGQKRPKGDLDVEFGLPPNCGH